MGDLVMRQRTRGFHWVALCVALGGALTMSCSSAPRRPAASAAPAAAPASSAVAEPAAPATPPAVVIETLDLREGAPGMMVDLAATGPLVWTSYRKDTGELVVELPNTEPGSSVPAEIPGEGVVAALTIERDGSGSRPLTRLTVTPKGEIEHSLVADGNHLRLELVPVADTQQTALSYEPLPEEPAASAESVEPEDTARGEVAYGTADQPQEGPAPSGAVASRLTAVDVRDDGSVVLTGDGELSYSTFHLEDPDRFVIDLRGVVNASRASSVQVGSAAVRRVRTAQFRPLPEPVSRVVFDLNGPAQPRIARQGNALEVHFGEATAVAVSAPRPAVAPEPRHVAESAPPGKPVSEPARTVAAPRAVASPAPSSELTALAEPRAAAEPSAEAPPKPQAIRPTPPPAAKAPEPAPPAEKTEGPQTFTTRVFGTRTIGGQQRTYYGDPVTMTLRDADVVEVLRSFAGISKLSIVVQPEVRGSVTVEFDDVPWDQALEQILRVNRLGYELEGTVMRIAPVSVLKDEAKEQQELARAKALQIPLRTVMRRLSYASAQDAAGLLRAQGGLLSQRGSVIIDRRTNTLIIKELPDYVDTVIAVIDEIDTPEPQVMIEARIVETTKRFSRSLGVSWSVAGEASPRLGNTTGLVFPSTVAGQGGVNLVTGARNGFINLALGNVLDSLTLDVTLQAAENEGLIKILSAPKVAVLNNEAANIQSGLQIPVQTIANNTVTTQFINATLSLDVVPHVTAEGTVLMDIAIRKREPQLAFAVVGATNAPIATKEARTRVIVRDGGTTVIGGIYKVSSDQGEDRVPGLANIPIIGHIFKNKRRTDENEELLIFITPRVVNL